MQNPGSIITIYNISIKKFMIEGTVSVILIYPLCKDGNARFTTVPLKDLSV